MNGGRVRAMLDDAGNQLDSAGPSTPIEILGLSGAPSAGDLIVTVADESRAREISSYRQRKARELAVAHQAGQRGSLEQMMSSLQIKGADMAPMVIKADAQGSVEAITAALNGLGTDEVQARGGAFRCWWHYRIRRDIGRCIANTGDRF